MGCFAVKQFLHAHKILNHFDANIYQYIIEMNMF